MTTHKIADLVFTATETADETKILVKGSTPDGQRISYKCRMDKVVSVCAQITADGYGVIHIIFGYKGATHPFQLQIIPGMSKKEIQNLVDWLNSMC